MSVIAAIPLPSAPTKEQAARKYWMIRLLDREGHMDPVALRTHLATLAPVIPSAARDLSRLQESS